MSVQVKRKTRGGVVSPPKNRRIGFNSQKEELGRGVALWDQVQVLLNPRCKVDVNRSGKYTIVESERGASEGIELIAHTVVLSLTFLSISIYISYSGYFSGRGDISWLSSEPQNIYPRILNSDLMPLQPETNRAN